MPIGSPAVGSDRLNNAFRATAHNAFEPQRAPALSVVLEHVSSLEIDFWDDEIAPFFGARPNAWFVRHLPLSGNVSNGRPPGDLRACLLDVREKLFDAPAQCGAFVFLDKQQGWGESRSPRDLDALLVELFGAAIFRPADLMGSFLTPKAAVLSQGWCSLDALAGRVCFILTGGRWGDDTSGANSVLSEYVNLSFRESVCFVAPQVREHDEISGTPQGFGTHTAPWVVMFNNPADSLHLSPAIHEAGLMSRVYFAADSDATYHQCIAAKVNFIAIDAFLEQHWNGGLMNGRLPT